MRYMYFGMSKGTCQDEAMLKSSPLALAIIELRLSEGIRWTGSQSVENNFLNFVAIY